MSPGRWGAGGIWSCCWVSEPVRPHRRRSLSSRPRAYADAEPLFRKLVASHPREVAYLYYHARSLAPLGRPREAIAALERTVELDPHLRPAWQGLVALYEGEGMKGAAEQAAARVRFLGFVPPFLQAPYSPEAAATAARLSGHHEGEVDVMKELRALAADPSETSTKLLAAYVLGHPHDASETLAFDALRARAKSIGGDMLLLAEHADSKCISRPAYSILAEHFDVPQARAALEKVRARDDLAPFAAAALYRLSRDPAHLQGLTAALAGRGYDALHVIDALSDLTEPEATEARRLLEEQSEREDAE